MSPARPAQSISAGEAAGRDIARQSLVGLPRKLFGGKLPIPAEPASLSAVGGGLLQPMETMGH